MDQRTLRLLEFHKIQEKLAEYTTFSGGRELALALLPSANPIWVEEGQAETAEALHMLDGGMSPPFGGLTDIRPHLQQAALGAILDEIQLLQVADTAANAYRLARYIRQHAPKDGILADIAGPVTSHDGLEREIRRCIAQDGTVKDNASPELESLRRKIRTLQARIRERLQSIVREAAGRNVLQESLVTVRDGRYVIPVKQEHRHAVAGVLHDQSASGATLFIEPAAIVEMNNELRRIESEEKREIERILRKLTEEIRSHQHSLATAVEICSRLDLAFAKAQLAVAWNCVRPEINREGWLNIREGRHPLLTGEVVPINVWLGRDFRALVITGPNTGGKTVTLKTVGLFVLMAQAGLHVPAAEGTEIPLVPGVYADIGDEQSIEQSLSTFSAHMKHIVDILSRVERHSLVLLDELGAGTDPAEGAALAMAFLEYLLQKDARVIATTHLGELKSFAYNEPGVENASVEFDITTLRPTYRLLIGVAGSSNAFAIAERLGLSPVIIERARRRLSIEEQRVDELLRRVEADLRRAEQERTEAERLRAELEEEKQKYVQARQRLHEQREEILERSRREAEQLLKEARLESERWIGRLRKRAEQATVAEAEAARRALEKQAEKLRPEVQAPKHVVPEAPALHHVKPGERVRIRSLQQVGEVLSPPDGGGHVLIQAGALKLTVPIADLERVEAPAGNEKTRSRRPATDSLSKGGWGDVARRTAMNVSPEIHLRGLYVEESLEKLDKFLDEAVLANLSRVRVIHGKGTGTLRRAVHEWLRADPRVRHFQLADSTEGGLGVTVVEL